MLNVVAFDRRLVVRAGALVLACAASTWLAEGSTSPVASASRAARADGGAPAVATPESPVAAVPLYPLGEALRVRPVGRFEETRAGGLRFAWSLSTLRARFRGTGISMRLHDDGKNVFSVLVDGHESSVLTTGRSTNRWPLATGLALAEHEIAVVKRTEARDGEATFFGFDVQGGALLDPPAPSARRIELVGDSITAGYGAPVPGGPSHSRLPCENVLASYGAMVAAGLGADAHVVAWSSKTIGEVADLWERTLPARKNSRWDATRWVPDVVVVNLGTNDLATQDPGEAGWKEQFSRLVGKFREAYGGVPIVLLLGPLLTDSFPAGAMKLTRARRYMAAFKADLDRAGERNVVFVEVPTQRAEDGYGCGFHPSPKTQALMAEILTLVIEDRLGW